ncbi:ABC transporter permease [Halobacillus campisalis]|uniref:ABC transporter permease n=1 Tax=Halobacillus campisalis TaxID=435909 RepID=A0ABW2K7E8_9BACI|nr:ABC transporter permease subunit [Halobacillus campisalis]
MRLFRNNPWLLLLPALLFLILPSYGLATAILESLRGTDGFTGEHYETLFASDRFTASFLFSIRTAFIATVLSLVAGVLLTRTFSGYLEKNIPRLSVWLPMVFPHLVWGYIIILLFAETGLFSQLLVSLGWIGSTNEFPIWTRDSNGIGIILTYIWKEIPFVILMLFPVYSAIPRSYYDLVETLGGSRWDQFKTVELPRILPVLLEIFLIIFAFTLTAYEVPALLGTTFPEMISVLSYQWFYSGSFEDRPLAFAAMTGTSFLIMLGALAAYLYLNRKRMRAMRGRL